MLKEREVRMKGAAGREGKMEERFTEQRVLGKMGPGGLTYFVSISSGFNCLFSKADTCHFL